jgi:hypothetical protein
MLAVSQVIQRSVMIEVLWLLKRADHLSLEEFIAGGGRLVCFSISGRARMIVREYPLKVHETARP